MPTERRGAYHGFMRIVMKAVSRKAFQRPSKTERGKEKAALGAGQATARSA